MRYYNYITEKKWLKGTMMGFPIKPGSLKRVRDYIRSWLERYKVDFDEVMNPHFSIAQIVGNYEKPELIRKMNKIKDISFNSKDIKIFRGVQVPKDFIVLEYKPNLTFIKSVESVARNFDIRKFEDVRPHVSLFTVEQGKITDELLKDIKYSLPKLPKLKTKEIGLWNNKFEMESKV